MKKSMSGALSFALAAMMILGISTIASAENPTQPPAGYNPPDLPAGYTALTEWPDASSAGLVDVTKDDLTEHLYGPERIGTSFTSDKKPNLDHADNILVDADDGVYTTDRLLNDLYVVDVDGTAIENTYIHGGLSIRAKNVTIRNCYIEAQYAYQGGRHADATGVIEIEPGASASIINCEINGMEGVHAGIWNQGESMVAVGNNIYGSDDGIFHWTDENSQYTGKTGNNFRVQDNWIHNLTDTTSNGHIDGWQTTAASNGIIKNNYFDLPGASSGNFALYGGWAISQYIMVEGNLFQGSGYTIYCYSNNPNNGPVENIWFLNNAFSTKYGNLCGLYGTWFPNNEPCDGWFNSPSSWEGSFRSGNYYWDPDTDKAVRSADPQPLPDIPDDAWVCAGNGAFAAGKHDLGKGNTGYVQTKFVIVPLADFANSGIGYTVNGDSTGWGQMSVCLMLNKEGFFDIYDLIPDEDNPGQFVKWWKNYALTANMSDDELPPDAVRYEAGKAYQIRMMIDVGEQTFSTYVTRLDNNLKPLGDEVCIGEDAQYRATGMSNVRYFYTSPGTQDTYYVLNHEVDFDYNQVSWVDVNNDTPHKDAIDFISARGITIGVGKGKFDPDGELTRAQLLVMIMRAYGITEDTPYECNFDDVAGTGVWYEDWVGIAKDMGITLGSGNNKFGEAPVTHAQALLFMHRTLKALEENLTPVDGEKTLADYDDADELPSWALSEIDAFEELVAAGIYDEDALMPNRTATRALMAQLIYNLLTR